MYINIKTPRPGWRGELNTGKEASKQKKKRAHFKRKKEKKKKKKRIEDGQRRSRDSNPGLTSEGHRPLSTRPSGHVRTEKSIYHNQIFKIEMYKNRPKSENLGKTTGNVACLE